MIAAFGAGVLGVFIKPVEKIGGGADDGFAAALMDLILDIRREARETKNWGVADKIRDSLSALNVVVEDRPDGVKWSRS